MEDGPEIVNGDFYYYDNQLHHKYLPNYVEGYFYHDGNKELGINKDQPLNEIRAIVLYHNLKNNLNNTQDKPKINKI